jgi:hypothetical protein
MGADFHIQLFLLRLRKVWDRPDRIFLAPRPKNLASMARLGFVMADIRVMCIELRPEERIAGPCVDDKSRPGDIWVFHHTYKGQLMYLKFSLDMVDSQDVLTIISCHEEGLA